MELLSAESKKKQDTDEKLFFLEVQERELRMKIMKEEHEIEMQIKKARLASLLQQ